MKKLLPACIILTLGYLFYSGNLYATQIYKCKGPDGSPRFQQTPCGSSSRSFKLNNSDSSDDKKDTKVEADKKQDRLDKQKSMADQMEQERLLKKEEKQKKRAKKIKAKQNCTRAKDRLADYKRSRGVYRLDKEGRKVYGNEADRQRAIRNMQKSVAYWCKKAGRN